MKTTQYNIEVPDTTSAGDVLRTDELYGLIGSELKQDAELQYKFKAFFLSKLSGMELVEAFAKVLQPKLIKWANDLDHRLTFPLYAALSRFISAEWVAEGPKDKDTGMLQVFETYAKGKEVEQDPYLAGIEAKTEAREAGMSSAFEAPYVGKEVVFDPLKAQAAAQSASIMTTIESTALGAPFKIEETLHGVEDATTGTIEGKENVDAFLAEALPFTMPPPISQSDVPAAFKNSHATRDRSKPVLTVAVLRGLEELLETLDADENGQSIRDPGVTRGRPDTRTALKWAARMVDWKAKK